MSTLDDAIREAVADALAPLATELHQLRHTVAEQAQPIRPVCYRYPEAAEALRISESTLSKLIANGDLATVTLPGTTVRRIPVEAVDALVGSDRWQVGNVVPIRGVAS